MAVKVSKFVREKLKYECYCRNLGERPCYRAYSKNPKQNKKWYMRLWYVKNGAISMREIYGDTEKDVLQKYETFLTPAIHDVGELAPQYTQMDLSLVMIRLNKLRPKLSFPIKVEKNKTYFTGHLIFRDSELSKMNIARFPEKEREIITEIVRLEKQYIIIKKQLSKESPNLDLDNL